MHNNDSEINLLAKCACVATQHEPNNIAHSKKNNTFSVCQYMET